MMGDSYEKMKSDRELLNRQLKNYLRGRPICCSKCNLRLGVSYKDGKGIERGLTSVKRKDKYYCQYCAPRPER